VPAKWPSGDSEILAGLPEEEDMALPGGWLAVVHGNRAGPVANRHAWLRRTYATARAVVYGHSHRLVCDQSSVPWVLNPGSAGQARTFGGPSCLVLHASAHAWHPEILRFAPA
jgi:predicted phosphodiesterase